MIWNVSSHGGILDKDGCWLKTPAFSPSVGSLTTYRHIVKNIYVFIFSPDSVPLTDLFFLHLVPSIPMHFMHIHDGNSISYLFMCCSGFTACTLGDSSLNPLWLTPGNPVECFGSSLGDFKTWIIGRRRWCAICWRYIVLGLWAAEGRKPFQKGTQAWQSAVCPCGSRALSPSWLYGWNCNLWVKGSDFSSSSQDLALCSVWGIPAQGGHWQSEDAKALTGLKWRACK